MNIRSQNTKLDCKKSWATSIFVASGGALGLLAFWVFFLWLSWNWVPLPQLGYLQDLGILVDAGWRFVQGQMPHRDYVSPLGPAYALYAGLPQYLFGAEYASYTHAQTVFGSIVSMLSYLLLFKKLGIPTAVIYSLIVGVVGAGTYHIGGPPILTTFATVYNRHLWSFLMILAPVFLLKACVSDDGSRRNQVLVCFQGFVVGVIIAVLFFYKINFWIAALLMLAAGLALKTAPTQTKMWIAIFVGYLLCSLAFLWAISWRLDAMLRDLTFAAAGRNSGWMQDSFYFDPLRVIMVNMVPLLISLLFVIYVYVYRGCRHSIAALIVLIGGFGLMTTNANGSGLGIPLLITCLLICCFPEASVSRGRSMLESFLLWGIFGIVAIAYFVWPQVVSWSSWVNVSKIVRESRQPLPATGTPLEGLYDSSDNMWGPQFWPRIREGVSLIRNSTDGKSTLLYVDFTNIFNFAAAARSPQGTFLWVDHLSTFGSSPGGYIDPDQMFADVDFVMFPKYPLVPEVIKRWLQLYEQTMNRLFIKVAETDNFLLFSRVTRRQ